MNVEAGLYKTLTYLGLVLLLGGALFVRRVGPGLGRPLGVLGLGAMLVAAGSLLEVLAALRPLLGTVTWADYVDYLLGSSQGRATLWRLALTSALLALEVSAARPGWPSAVLSAGLLTAVAATGHGRVGGTLTHALHVAHLGAVVAWAGAVSFLAWQGPRRWREQAGDVQASVRRVSATGLWSVLILAASGAAAALAHVPGAGALTATPYGLLLTAKVATFAAVLLLAARNRFRLLRPGRADLLRLTMRAESVLLVLILALSGLLTSSAPPDPPVGSATTPVRLRFRDARVEGQFRTAGTGSLTADLTVRGSGAVPAVTLVMTDHAMPDVRLGFERQGGRLVAHGQLWMDGTWVADVLLNGETRRVPLWVR